MGESYVNISTTLLSIWRAVENAGSCQRRAEGNQMLSFIQLVAVMKIVKLDMLR